MRQGRGGGRLLFLVIVVIYNEIEQIALARHVRRSLEGGRRHRADGEAGRQAPSLLDRGKTGGQAPRGHLEFNGSHGTHGIDVQQYGGIFCLHQVSNIFQRIQHPRGGLIVHQGHHVVATGSEGLVHVIRGNGKAPLPFQGIAGQAARLGYFVPARPKRAVDQIEAPLPDAVAHGRFPRAGGGMGAEKHLFCPQELLHARGHFGPQPGKLGGAVPQGRPGHGREGIRRYRGRAGDEQLQGLGVHGRTKLGRAGDGGNGVRGRAVDRSGHRLSSQIGRNVRTAAQGTPSRCKRKLATRSIG